MNLTEKLMKNFEQLPDEKKKQVIDFVEFIKTREQKEVEGFMDAVIAENIDALKELAK